MYQKSIEKSRAAEAVINVRALAESAKRVKLATGSLPATLAELDISLPFPVMVAANSSDSEILAGNYFAYYVDLKNNTAVARRRKSSTDTDWGHSDYSIGYWFQQDPRTTSTAMSADSMICAVLVGGSKEAFYKSVCKSLGAKDSNSAVVDGYTHYKIN